MAMDVLHSWTLGSNNGDCIFNKYTSVDHIVVHMYGCVLCSEWPYECVGLCIEFRMECIAHALSSMPFLYLNRPFFQPSWLPSDFL